jgi:hypothetical protein
MDYKYPNENTAIGRRSFEKKPRTEKQRAANLKRSEKNKELTSILKQHRLRGNLKTRHALRQWRKNGKSNQNFFNGMQSQQLPRASSKQVFPSSTRRLSIPQPFQEPLLRRPTRQYPVRQYPLEPQLPVELEAELETNLETNLESKYKPFPRKFQTRNLETNLETNLERNLEAELETNLESKYKPFPRQFQTRKVRSGHSLAGKKAESSIKGKAWLEDVKRAKNILDKVLQEAGIEEKGHQMDARRLASMLRKDPQTANQFVDQVVSKTLRKKRIN